MADGPNIFLHVTGGLGDVLAEFFCPQTSNQPRLPLSLPRMLHAWREDMAGQIGVVYRSGCPNRAVPQLFAAMGLRTYMAEFIPKDYSERPKVHGLDLSGWVDASTLTEPAEIEIAECPTVQPLTALPKKYILLNESASHPERRLTDPEIYRLIKRAAPGIPIVKVGTQRPMIPADIELTDLTTAAETVWIAKHATMIVSAATFHRCFASLFGVRAIELLDERRASDTVLVRTKAEYELGRYGITPEKNKWMLWPTCREELLDDIRRTLAT